MPKFNNSRFNRDRCGPVCSPVVMVGWSSVRPRHCSKSAQQAKIVREPWRRGRRGHYYKRMKRECYPPRDRRTVDHVKEKMLPAIPSSALFLHFTRSWLASSYNSHYHDIYMRARACVCVLQCVTIVWCNSLPAFYDHSFHLFSTLAWLCLACASQKLQRIRRATRMAMDVSKAVLKDACWSGCWYDMTWVSKAVLKDAGWSGCWYGMTWALTWNWADGGR